MKDRYSPSLVEGLRHTKTMTVNESDLDTYWGIGHRNVLAIPTLISFIEQTVAELLNPYLNHGYESIVVELNMKHERQAVLGESIHCNIHLKFIDESSLFFDVSVIDEDHEELTHGAIERMIVSQNN
ncbi:MAG: hotdog domain-containing protein [Breznakibacter sp.]